MGRDFNVLRIDESSILVTYSLARRYLAGLIDIVIFGFYLIVFSEISSSVGFILGFLVGPINLTVFAIYFFLPELFWGQTLGKVICDLKVVVPKVKSSPLLSIFLRNILRLVEFGIPLVSIWMIALTKDNQRIGDFAGSTIVVRKSYLDGINTSPVPKKPKVSGRIILPIIITLLPFVLIIFSIIIMFVIFLLFFKGGQCPISV